MTNPSQEATIKVSDYVARFLEERSVTHVFELVGGMITHMIDSLHQRGRIKIVSVHHEQSAAFAADATGRMTGLPGVALATSGPGAVNLLTGIGSCYFDSAPAVFLTGQVNRDEMRGQHPIRQLGFQETDIVAMAKPITKAAWLAGSPEEVPSLLERAFALANDGRPGPVLVDLPMDVQRGLIPRPAAAATPAVTPRPVALGSLWEDLARAERPLVLAGGGVRASRAHRAFVELAEKLAVPVVHSLMGVDILPAGHPLRVGMIGTYGNRWANLALAQADFLLVVGSRLDVRQTGADTKSFGAGKTIHHVDVDAVEINNRVPGCHAIIAHLRDFMAGAVGGAPAGKASWSAWRQQIDRTRAEWPDTGELAHVPGINPNAFMHALARACTGVAGYIVDVGQHQMWAGQSLDLGPQQRFLTSGGMGSMGYALPAAIGATMTSGQPVVMIAGDGGFQCNIQELETVAHHKLPIRMVVVDNHCLGMVRQFQESYFESRYPSTLWGYSAPDFVRVALAYGIEGRAVDDATAVDAAVRWLAAAQGPALLHLKVDPSANAYPKIAFGRPITDMEPFTKPDPEAPG
jgi:acetolactate synthase I/II/III large subunit